MSNETFLEVMRWMAVIGSGIIILMLFVSIFFIGRD